MATTPNYGIVYPTTADAVSPLANLFSNLASSVDTAFVNFAAARNKNLVGLAANKPASGTNYGDTYQETDSNKILWKWDGSNWVTNEAGLILIRPSSVVGATVNADGSISPTGSVTNFSVNNIFTTRFRAFAIKGFCNSAATTAIGIRLRASGTDQTSATYVVGKINAVASGTPANAENATTGFEIASQFCTSHAFDTQLEHPAHSTSGQTKMFTGISRGIGTNSYTQITGAHGSGFDTTSYDGLTLYTYGPAVNLTALSWIKIYGIA